MIGQTRIQKCSSYAMCARKRAALYLNRRFPKRQQKCDQAKRVAAQKARRTPDNGNTLATSFGFITTTSCKLSRRNPRGFCSSFLLQKIHRPDDGIASRMCCLHPNETESVEQCHPPHFSRVVRFSSRRCGRGADPGGPEIQAIAIHRV